ncbi:MAG: PorP/SprF family type IX secretion system membrane protein [Bacteroidota bacterium]|jgi:type IX secretion system PorP/SprF family membrane protein
MKKYYFITTIFIVTVIVNAQDFHLSQYDAFNMYNNPALTGNYFGEKWAYRINSSYREQWRQITSKPFSTYGIGFDAHSNGRGARFGYGGYIINNKSGVAGINSLSMMLSGSYYITKPEESPHCINVGLQLGAMYKSFNPNNLLFETQYDYNTGTLNPEISSGENFVRNSMLKFDANMGVYYKYKEKDDKLAPFIGLSVFHLNMPRQNFTSESSRTPMRFSLQAGTDYKLNDKIKLISKILYMYQAKATELNIGILGDYLLTDGTDKEPDYHLVFGLGYRLKDAFIIHAGAKRDNIILRFSYDATTNYLRNYNSSRGAFEMSLVFIGFKSKQKFKIKSMF